MKQNPEKLGRDSFGCIFDGCISFILCQNANNALILDHLSIMNVYIDALRYYAT